MGWLVDRPGGEAVKATELAAQLGPGEMVRAKLCHDDESAWWDVRVIRVRQVLFTAHGEDLGEILAEVFMWAAKRSG